MRRIAIVSASIGLLGLAAAPLVRAGDPPAPAPAPAAPAPAAPSDEAAKIQRLVEDLGSADFRIREAATKALIDMGEKARPALEAAAKSDSPAVRFRADQILQRLTGARAEKPLDDGTQPAPGAKDGKPERGGLGWGGRRFFTDDDFEKMRQDMERRIEELRKELERGGIDAWGGFRGWPSPFEPRRLFRADDLHLKVDGGDTWAELWEGARGAKIQFTDKSDPSNVTTSSGKSIAQILQANPKLREWPGARELLAKYEEASKERQERRAKEEAERDEREKARKEHGAMPFGGVGRSVQTEVTDGHVKVTITDTDADGKTTTKTYEGTDMESLRRDHPELDDVLGGIHIQIGPHGAMPPLPPMPPRGPKPLGEDDGQDGGFGPVPSTGPFGLALAPLDDMLRSHLGVEAGKGAVVLVVRPDSDAAKLGLKANDVIMAVNGTAITDLDGVAKAFRAVEKDAPLTVDVIRAGKPLQLKR